MYPFATHVTCRIRRYEESVNRLAEALTRPGVPGPGVAAGPLYERVVVRSLLGFMEEDDPEFHRLSEELEEISARLDEVFRGNQALLHEGLIRDLRTTVDHSCSAACWRELGIRILPDDPGIRDRIGVLIDAIGGDPAIADLRCLAAVLDLSPGMPGGEEQNTADSTGSAAPGKACQRVWTGAFRCSRLRVENS